MNQIFTLGPGANLHDILTGISWDYDEIYCQVSTRVQALRKLGVKRGHNILISHGGTPQFLADLWAVWHIGGCASCINVDLTMGEKKNVEKYLNPEIVLLGPGKNNQDQLFFGTTVDLSAIDLKPDTDIGDCRLQPDDPALILFTSGTTSKPKGVVHTRKSIFAKLTSVFDYVDPDVMERTLTIMGLHYVSGLFSGSLAALNIGKAVYLFQAPGIEGAARLGQIIDDFEITFANTNPSIWKIVLKVSNPPVKNSLRQINSVSSALDKKTWQAVIKWSGTNNVFGMYGTTELGGWNTGISSAEHSPETGLIGKPWSGEAAVLTPEGKRTTTGNGELLLKTTSLMQGYYQDQPLTDEVIKDGWYYTGDLCEIDEQGLIWFKGRGNLEINRGGNMVSPEEIDRLLSRHPGIYEACAFGIPDRVSGETVACAVSIKEGCEVQANDLHQWCLDRIRPICIPEKWFFMKSIPKTPRGKYNHEKVAKACQLQKGNT